MVKKEKNMRIEKKNPLGCNINDPEKKDQIIYSPKKSIKNCIVNEDFLITRNNNIINFKGYINSAELDESDDVFKDCVSVERIEPADKEKTFRNNSSIISFQQRKSSNTREPLKLIQKKIENIAESENIKVKIFKKIAQKTFETKYEKAAFIAASSQLLDLVEKKDLPIYGAFMVQKQMDDFIVDPNEPNYYTRDHKKFIEWVNQNVHKYAEIIYIISPLTGVKLSKTDEYIGRTRSTKDGRFEGHIKDVLISYFKDMKAPSRPIEKLLFIVMEEVVANEKYERELEIYGCDSLNEFLDVYKKLHKHQKKIIREQMVKILLRDYFKMEIVEVHRTFRESANREQYYKKKYTYKGRVDEKGDLLIGTVFDVGLNPNAKLEGILDYVSIPLYDVAFLISMGYNIKEITKLLRDNYDEDIKYSIVNARISQFWDGFKKAQKKFLKPVVLSLIQSNPKITQLDIVQTIKVSRDFFKEGLGSKWFGKVKFSELKYAIHSVKIPNINIDSIKEIIYDIKNGRLIRGHLRYEWEQWFTYNIGSDEVAKLTGFSSGNIFRNSFFGYYSDGKPKYGTKVFGVKNYKEAVMKYQRIKTLDLISQTPDITFEAIYSELGGASRDEYTRSDKLDIQLKKFFERMFKQHTYEQLEKISLRSLYGAYKEQI